MNDADWLEKSLHFVKIINHAYSNFVAQLPYEEIVKVVREMMTLADAIKQRDKRAEDIIAMLEDDLHTLEDFYNLEPIDGLTVLSIMAKMKDENGIVAKKIIETGINKINSERGKNGAAAKLLKDKKQAEKILVKKCWDDWQKNPSDYPSNAEFARDMLKHYTTLKNSQTIERWCSTWGKTNIEPS